MRRSSLSAVVASRAYTRYTPRSKGIRPRRPAHPRGKRIVSAHSARPSAPATRSILMKIPPNQIPSPLKPLTTSPGRGLPDTIARRWPYGLCPSRAHPHLLPGAAPLITRVVKVGRRVRIGFILRKWRGKD